MITLFIAAAILAGIGFVDVPAAFAEDVLVVDLVRTDAYPRIAVRFTISPVVGVAPTDLQPRHLTVTEAGTRQISVDVFTVSRAPDGRSATYETSWVSQAVGHPGDFVPGSLAIHLTNTPESQASFTYLKPLLTRGDPIDRKAAVADVPAPLMALRAVPQPAPASVDVRLASAVAGVVGGVAILSLAAAAGWRMYRQEVEERLASWASVPVSGRRRAVQTKAAPRRRLTISPAVGALARLGARLVTPAQSEKLRKNLMLAGRPTTRDYAQLIATKVALGLLFAAAGAAVMWGRTGLTNMLMISGGLAIAGFLLPNLWLGKAIKRRQYQIRKSLPDALDLMTIGVTAGLAFDGAINEIVEKWDNALSREFSVLLGELRMGTGRREALLNLVERTDVEEIRTVVTQIIQSDELGMSLSETLQTLAAQMRLRRRQQAEEQAHKAAVKMLIPLVFLIFPALFVVIIGPAVPDLISYVTGVGNTR